MNSVIREAGKRQAAEAKAARELEESKRAERLARMKAEDRSIDLLRQALGTLASILVEAGIKPEAKFSRKAEHPPEAPAEEFYIPQWSSYSRWYMPKQSGWYLATSSRWDASLRLLGESDLRVAILANGRPSRFIPLETDNERRQLAHDIVECAARHDVVWPDDGPDLTELLEDAS